MSPSRKRPRIDSGLIAEAELNSKTMLDMVQGVLGRNANVFFLYDFVDRYAPSLSLTAASSEATDEIKRLAQSMVCPSKTVRPVPSLKNAECRESLSNIVDDVIWSLVHQRARKRQRRTEHDQQEWHGEGRNVLCQGYVLASEHLQQKSDVRPCPNMRPGILCTQINSNVSFCKSSQLCRTLHRLVGDTMLRMILLQTTLLIPIKEKLQRSRGNYLLLCGCTSQLRSSGAAVASPVRVVGPSLSTEDELKKGSKNSTQKRKRKKSCTDASSVLKNKRATWDPNATIPRHSLFYSNAFLPRSGLPANHILNCPKNSKELLNDLFHLYAGGKKRRRRWARLRDTGIAMCDQIFERHGKCDYARLLDRYCPIPRFKEMQQKDSPLALDQLVTSHTPAERVHSFICAVLRKVFPPRFWGSEHNFQRVVDVVRIFLKLRRRESLPNKALVDGIRVTELTWLSDGEAQQNSQCGSTKKKRLSRTNHLTATTLVQYMIHWLFCKYLIPLLRSTFYITEGEFCAKRVLYYRKPVWSMFRSVSMKLLLEHQYIEIDGKEASRRLKHQSMGLSRLRLLPKKTGVRPVATLSKREFIECGDGNNSRSVEDSCNAKEAIRPPTKLQRVSCDAANLQRSRSEMKRLSTNRLLNQTHEVLRYEHRRNPHASGSGVFGLNEVYPLLRNFLQDIEGRMTAECPRLYFTKVDIHRCYDNINQERLLNIASDLLIENDYLIQKYAVIHPFDCAGRALWKVVKTAGPPEKFQNFQFVASGVSEGHHKSIFVHDVSCSGVKKESVLDLLQEHLLRHMVVARGRYGERFLVQNNGIPQGSVLSSLLCNLYYGGVEKEMLSGLFQSRTTNEQFGVELQGRHLLMRIVDDFLLISTDHGISNRFLETMSVGSAQLGVQINGAKTLVNYDVQKEKATRELKDINVVGCDGGRTFFPWCGMLFDTVTGEVRVDYSRFVGEQAKDTLTIDRDGREGEKLRIRMRSFVRPRSQPILFDSRVNSAEVVVINFYQAMLFCAVKSVHYICEAMVGKVGTNASFILHCIDEVVGYSRKLIVKRLDQEGESARFGICESTALWLGRDAFLSVFENVKTDYKFVVNQLRSLCEKHPSNCRGWGGSRRMALNQFDLSRFFN